MTGGAFLFPRMWQAGVGWAGVAMRDAPATGLARIGESFDRPIGPRFLERSPLTRAGIRSASSRRTPSDEAASRWFPGYPRCRRIAADASKNGSRAALTS